MKWAFAFFGFVAVAFLSTGVLLGDDQEKKDTKVVKRGGLPANYAKLGLSDDQKKKIRDIQGDYSAKIADLEEQIKDLRKKERLAMEDVLTDTQKARLRELVLEKAPGASPGADKK